MPKKKSIDSKKLITMIEQGFPRPEIMEAFGFKTSTQLNTAYMNALVDEGKVPEIKSGRGGAAKSKVSNEAKVGKSGSRAETPPPASKSIKRRPGLWRAGAGISLPPAYDHRHPRPDGGGLPAGLAGIRQPWI